jgi:hypothetical protein
MYGDSESISTHVERCGDTRIISIVGRFGQEIAQVFEQAAFACAPGFIA